jgi:hypothetical protein
MDAFSFYRATKLEDLAKRADYVPKALDSGGIGFAGNAIPNRAKTCPPCQCSPRKKSIDQNPLHVRCTEAAEQC